MATLQLESDTWDLTLDDAGNIATIDGAAALAQDAASAIRTFLGECFFDTLLGVPYFTLILGHTPPLTILKQLLTDAALTVVGVAAARVFLNELPNRVIGGQVQVVSVNGETATATFEVVNPQGGG